MEIFCGIDWAEAHHDIAVVDEQGRVLAGQRISDDLAGYLALSELFSRVAGQHLPADGPVGLDIAIETDRGLLVAALRAAGHRIWSINPKAVDRYRDRFTSWRAKSDAGDAVLLASILRTDRHAHRPLPADSDLAVAIGVLARAHQDATWRRRGDLNRLRSLLREYFPAALTAFSDLTTRTALLILATTPTATAAAGLTEDDLVEVMRQAGRGTQRARAAALRQVFTAPAWRQPPAVEQAMGQAAAAIVASVQAANTAIARLEDAMAAHLSRHPDAGILTSMPGLGLILATRELGEFGDDPNRFTGPAARRAYATTAPVTRASGKRRVVIRRGGNRRLADACRLWAFATLTASPGARAHYRRRRAAGDGHEAALRHLANKLVGQLHHCLHHRTIYLEHLAWPAEHTPPEPDTPPISAPQPHAPAISGIVSSGCVNQNWPRSDGLIWPRRSWGLRGCLCA